MKVGCVSLGSFIYHVEIQFLPKSVIDLVSHVGLLLF